MNSFKLLNDWGGFLFELPIAAEAGPSTGRLAQSV
jgi:hypothetical protein